MKTGVQIDPRYKRLANRDKLGSKALAYVRVSTDDQELGIEAQLEALKKWSLVNHVVFDKIYKDEGVSGKTDPAQRPGLRDLLRHVEVNEIDYVVVFRLDRLSRDVSINGFVEFILHRYQCRLLTVDQKADEELTPEQKLMRTVVAGMAEYERSLISMRTKGALAAAKKKGIQLGRRKRLSYKENCKLFYVIRYLDKYGCSVEYMMGYLANHCQTVLSDSTLRRYKDEDEVPFHFPCKEVVDVLKPFYRMRNGKHMRRLEGEKVQW